MNKDKGKQTTLQIEGNSQAKAYLGNQRQHQQMLSPTIPSRSHSAFSSYSRDQHQQQGVLPCTPYLVAQSFPVIGSTPPPKVPKRLKDRLMNFWDKQYEEAEKATDFKTNSLPLARIKKIIKSDKDVRMVSADACILFAKACEMFIKEITIRSWIHTEENQRRTLSKSDIATAIANHEIYDFLVDTISEDDIINHTYSGIQGTSSNSGNLEIAPNVHHITPPRNIGAPSYGLPRMIMGSHEMHQPWSTTQVLEPQQNESLDPNNDDYLDSNDNN